MVLIVVPPKRVDLLLRVLQRREPVHVQTLFPKSSVERFDRGVVRRFAAPTEVEDDSVGIRPQIHGRTDKLGPVVAVDPLRESALESEALERRGNLLATKPVAEVDREALTSEEVDHRKRAESSPIGQWVGDK